MSKKTDGRIFFQLLNLCPGWENSLKFLAPFSIVVVAFLNPINIISELAFTLLATTLQTTLL